MSYSNAPFLRNEGIEGYGNWTRSNLIIHKIYGRSTNWLSYILYGLNSNDRPINSILKCADIGNQVLSAM